VITGRLRKIGPLTLWGDIDDAWLQRPVARADEPKKKTKKTTGPAADTAPARFDYRPLVVLVTVAVGLTVLAAQVSIPLPFTPVPFTLQPMVVLLGGAAHGPRLGMLIPVGYLALGLAGFPLLAGSPLPQGVLRLLGPTGGYLMSYPFAAYLTGALAERGFDRNYRTSVLAMGAGLALIFACGIAWLAWFTRPVPAGLDAVGHNLFKETSVSGTAEIGSPAENGFGELQQGYLELSNVKVVEEMVNMILAQRAYEVNSKAVQSADEMMQMSNNLRR
jgi:biotin transporter BioY